jgi:capsular exopolysaccharide synthesis family protein
MFGIHRDPGMTHYLSGNTDDFDSLSHKTEIENLYVVPSGISPPNPSELLGSLRMRELIVDLKKRWDIILFDSPPIAAVTDATTMAQSLDSMVIVVKAGFTPKKSFFRALSAIDKVQTPLTGVVLNSVSKTNSYDTYYYYYQQDYHYYGLPEND